MSCGPSARHYHNDIVEELSKDLNNKDQNTESIFKKVPPSPHILCTVNNKNIWSLIDSGSQISAISEEFYKEISQTKTSLE